MVRGRHRELVLTGIHLGLYGRDLKQPDGMGGLVAVLLEKTDIARIRISSIDVNEIDDFLLELLQDEPRLCKHLHIAIQSGSPTVLRRMRRFYTAAQVWETLERLEREVEFLGLGADLIVGFPGESEREFEETLSVVRRFPFSYLHVFPFSARRGTPAASMQGRLSGTAIRERVAQLQQLEREKAAAFARRVFGRVQDLLVEEATGCELSGTTGEYLGVRAAGRRALLNQIVPVRIGERCDGVFRGDLLKEAA